MLFGQEHIDRYRETGGEVGHEWQPGVYTLLLTTTGRRTGAPHTSPLIYERDGDDYVVIASKGGHPDHPDWYLNLRESPEAQVQVGPDIYVVEAHDASGERRQHLWGQLAGVWPDYDHYAEKTDREIPVVVLTPETG